MTDTPEARLADGTPPATTQDVLDTLEKLGIEAETVDHIPVFTVEEAKSVRGQLPGAHTKNLFVRDKKEAMWLVVALEDRAVDLKALAPKIGMGRISFGSANRLMKYLGVIPGAVNPFAVINDHGGRVRVALDEGLKDHELWNFHPVDNAKTTTIRRDDMLYFLESVGHPPEWVEL